ncbi:MAG: chorismate synthase [Phycisphaerae bacterium]|nr:chorismate synthase [Phycisphaerae bacterium]
MARLDYRTAGESHGQALIALVEGMPAGVPINLDRVNAEMHRRQGGYGRGGRQKIEQDDVTLLSGVRQSVTLGSPIAIQIANKDFRIDEAPPVHRPRPGHADLAGSLKWLTTDCRGTLERASARETAARVAAGAVARCLLDTFGIEIVGFVVRIGKVQAEVDPTAGAAALRAARDANDVYCADPSAVEPMIEQIKAAQLARDTVGGIVEVQVHGLCPGVGSCLRWQDRLDGRLMHAVGAIQAFKGVEIGLGFSAAERPGSEVHDEIDFDPVLRDAPCLGFRRRSNHAGGLEGGMSNGQPIIVRGVMKPISTLLQGRASVSLVTRRPERSDYERSDVCAVPAASVVAEAVVAFEIARAFLEKFGGDTLCEVRTAYEQYLAAARALGERAGG